MTITSRPTTDWMDTVERVVRLFRPSFYNRLTWLVVISGLALLASPLWGATLASLIERYLGVSVVIPDRPEWGIVLCVVGLIYHLINTGLLEFLQGKKARDRALLKREHDRNVFLAAASHFDEQRFWFFLETLRCDHSYKFNNAEMLDEFTRFLEREENMFLSLSVQDSFKQMLKAWITLGEFLNVKFFIYPDGQVAGDFRACMTPWLNLDRQGHGTHAQIAEYDELTKQLHTKAVALETAYASFRKAVKLELVT